jgi:hypothetical protein
MVIGAITLYGGSVEGTYDVNGKCLQHVCNMSATCLQHVCNMSATCLQHVCNLSATCLQLVCNTLKRLPRVRQGHCQGITIGSRASKDAECESVVVRSSGLQRE